MPRGTAPQPCSAKKTSSDAQPSAKHAVCSSVEECYKVWPAVRKGIPECHGITGVQLIGTAFCCQLRQGVSDAEVQIAKLFGADVEVNACTCQQNASEKRYSGVQGRADLSLFCVTLDCPYCGSTVDLTFFLVTMQCSFLFCLHKSSHTESPWSCGVSLWATKNLYIAAEMDSQQAPLASCRFV